MAVCVCALGGLPVLEVLGSPTCLVQVDLHADRLRHTLSLKSAVRDELLACNAKLEQFSVRASTCLGKM